MNLFMSEFLLLFFSFLFYSLLYPLLPSPSFPFWLKMQSFPRFCMQFLHFCVHFSHFCIQFFISTFLSTSSFCFFPFSAKIAGFFAFLRAFFAFSHLFFLFLRIICIHFSCFNAFSSNYIPSGKYFLECLHQSKNRLKTHL